MELPSRRASLSSSAFLVAETRQLYTSVFMHYSVVHLRVSRKCLDSGISHTAFDLNNPNMY